MEASPSSRRCVLLRLAAWPRTEVPRLTDLPDLGTLPTLERVPRPFLPAPFSRAGRPFVATTVRTTLTLRSSHQGDCRQPPEQHHGSHLRAILARQLSTHFSIVHVVLTRSDISCHSMADHQLEAAIAEQHRTMSAAHARLLALLRVHASRGSYRSEGADTPGEWVASRLKLERSTAESWLACATRLARLPSLEAAFAAGTLSFDQVDALSKGARSEDDAWLATKAASWSTAQCRLYARRRHPASLREANTAHASRRLVMRHRKDGGLQLSGYLDPEGGAIVELALCDRAEQASPDPSTGQREPYRKRLADSLVDLIQAGHRALDPGRATVVLHVDASVLAGADEADTPGRREAADLARGGTAEVEGGSVLGAETARRLSCDSVWQVVAEAANDQAVHLAKERRSAPAWLRRELYRRDVTCRFPGCEHTRLLHAHHLVHWAKGGKTERSNLVLLCNRHHRFVHEEGWSITGDPDRELRFSSPDGLVLVSTPVPLDDTRNAAKPQAP
jgi:hypothetical protein